MSGLQDVLLDDGGAKAPKAAAAAAGGGMTLALALAAGLSSLSAGGFGYGIGAPNIPQSTIESDLGLGSNSLRWSMVVAAFTLAGFAGTQVAPPLVDRFGRRAFLAGNALLFVAGGAAMLAAGLLRAQQSLAYALLVLGRALWGLASGGSTVAVPLYLGEIAPAALTGTLGSITQFQITVWILVVQAMGIPMNTSPLWGWLLGGGGAALGAAAAAAALTLPESPRWLAARGRVDEARAALTWLRGAGAAAGVEAELEEMARGAAAAASAAAPSLGAILADRGLRAALLIAVTLQIAQQLSGINAVFFFSSSFFKDAGIADADYATLATGAVNVAATALAVYLVDRRGRKPLLLLSTVAMFACAAALTVTLVLNKDHTPALGAVSIGFVLLFVTFFELGIGPIPWMIGAEMCTEGPRSTIMGVAAAANWIFTTIIALAFGPVQSALGNWSFLPFCGFLALTFVFTILYVPETKGRSGAEVLEGLGGGYSKVVDSINE